MDITDLETKLNLKLKDPNILTKALTHRSFLNEHQDDTIGDNERLEFLGDAVLQLTVSKYLFNKYQEMPEGQMTTNRSSLVRTETLGSIARDLKLGNYMRMSKGEEESGGRDNNSLLANALESVIGAVYVDLGLTQAEKFITDNLLSHASKFIAEVGTDFKSQFQEKVQEKYHVAPRYRILTQSGPDHQKKFKIGVYVENKLVSTATDLSKQKASKKAAQLALSKLFD